MIAILGCPGDLSGSGGGFDYDKSSGKATTATTKKPPPEPDKSPGPPKLAIKTYLARVVSLVLPPRPIF